jgi:F-type H+-transporting ATPase subunit delta
MRQQDIAKALVELIKVLPPEDVPQACDNALKLLEKSGSHGLHDFPGLVLKALEEQEGILFASITTPSGSIGKEQLQKFNQLLEKAFGKKVQMTEIADPSLIGGAILRVGDEMYDSSIRAAISGMVSHFLQNRFQLAS